MSFERTNIQSLSFRGRCSSPNVYTGLKPDTVDATVFTKRDIYQSYHLPMRNIFLCCD